MNGLAATREEYRDNMGADACREAAEACKAAAVLAFLALLAGAGSAAMLVAAMVRLCQATDAAERLGDRQLAAEVIREAHYQQDYRAGYAAGYAAGLAGRRGRLRAV